MPLSNMQVLKNQIYRTASEILDQEIQLFNQATNGALVLSSGANAGDYVEKTLYQLLTNITRRRNAYGTGSVSSKKLTQMLETMVKVGGGTYPIEWTGAQYDWIQRNQAEHGDVLGVQLAQETLQDMVNTALVSTYAALSQNSDVTYDGTAGILSHGSLLSGTRKMGDRYKAIVAWIMHSKPYFDLIATGLTNSATLFEFGTVQVQKDVLGTPMIITDSPSLITEGSPDNYHTLGLVPGACVVEQNNDYRSEVLAGLGEENLKYTFQSEWSWNLGVKGYSWNTQTGGPSPTDAALAASSNWTKKYTSKKDLAGVVVSSL